MPHPRVLHFDKALLPEGWQSNVSIWIDDGIITQIRSDNELPQDAERHAVALPGMPNLHSHAFQRVMAGLTEYRGSENDDFWTWRELMYKLASTIRPDDLQTIAAMAQVEMLESGFTRVGEFHYLHHRPDGQPFDDIAEMSRAIFAAAELTGIAVTHLPVFYAHSGFGGQLPLQSQRRFVCDLDEFARLLEGCRAEARLLPDAVIGIAPHSLRAVTQDQLRRLEELADNIPIHIHIAEQMREVEDCQHVLGTTPVAWLLDNANVNGRWCLVHATHVTQSEVTEIARSGAAVGLCPITEANLGDGIFPAKLFADAGGYFGIGTDSNIRIDMTEELRLLEYGQRLSLHGRNILANSTYPSNGRFLFQSANEGGARALGVEAALRTGASADIISLKIDASIAQTEREDALIDQFVFATGSGAVDRVWRRGQCVVSEGRHIQRGEIEADYRKVLEALLA